MLCSYFCFWFRYHLFICFFPALSFFVSFLLHSLLLSFLCPLSAETDTNKPTAQQHSLSCSGRHLHTGVCDRRTQRESCYLLPLWMAHAQEVSSSFSLPYYLRCVGSLYIGCRPSESWMSVFRYLQPHWGESQGEVSIRVESRYDRERSCNCITMLR
ncbi:uncharacterized protein EDB91DRAFT_710055 [Suillus paluster]|uniref:uncharacterized protein n=1 Tax=Suillus paluster TaxID=48578 RepID=UPI001B87951E|nr:uncharacterized protein EDB91DRAFT_710055 [Suillus paluster]KAG1731868.1 hypothetical protein EDB91DRAFT_710055 [Suillus paluster]